jgi:hypothetical protein
MEMWRPFAAPPAVRACPFDGTVAGTAIGAISGKTTAAGAIAVTGAPFPLAGAALRTRSLAGGKALFPLDSACRRARDAARPSMATLKAADIGVR